MATHMAISPNLSSPEGEGFQPSPMGTLTASGPRAPRLQLATVVIGPLVIAAALSYAFKPMWLHRVFIPFVPFICLFVGAAAAARIEGERLPARLRVIGFALLALVWASVATLQQFSRVKGDGYRPAAQLVGDLQRAGDVVIVDGDYYYWCFSWYYNGPAWGEPRHAFIVTPAWTRMM